MWHQSSKPVQQCLTFIIKITLRTRLALILMERFFFFLYSVFLGSVDVNNTFMRIREIKYHIVL